MDTFSLISGKPKRTVLFKCLCLHINLSGIRLLSDNGERNMAIVCLYKKNIHAVKHIPYNILEGNGLSDKLRHFPTSPLQQLNGVCRPNFSTSSSYYK